VWRLPVPVREVIILRLYNDGSLEPSAIKQKPPDGRNRAESVRLGTLLTVFFSILLGFCSVLAVAGCGLFGAGSKAKIASKQSGTPSVTKPAPGPEARERPARQESPQRVAASHRVEQAKELIDAGDFVRAVSDLEKALAMDSTNPHTYLQLARGHRGLGNFRESLNFLEVAESLFGDEATSLIDVWVLKGDNLQSLGQLPQARQSYKRVFGIDPRNEKAAGRLRLVPHPS